MAAQGPPTAVVPKKQYIEATPYDVESPLPGPTLPSQKVKLEAPLVPKETQAIGEGPIHKPTSRPLHTAGGAFLYCPYPFVKG